MTTQREKEVACVRELARRVMEIAESPGNAAVIQRWCDVNAMRKPDRPPVWCRGPSAFAELMPPETFTCEDPQLLGLEKGFRTVLLKHDIGDDSPVESFLPVSARLDLDPPNVWGVDVEHTHSGEEGGAWAYDPPLKTEADFDKLVLPTVTYNREETERAMTQMADLLGDAMPVRQVCRWPISGNTHPILCSLAGHLRGLSQMLMDLAMAPELMHRLMAHLRDGVMGLMDQLEATGLLTPNNIGGMYTTDPIGDTSDGVTFANLLGHGNSQEFDQVSPAMFEEYLLDYQRPILERFGVCSYGCCENLTTKIDPVLTLKNLRIFISSAWTDIDKVIDKAGDDTTIMWRQKASDVVFPDDTAAIATHLDEGCRKLKGCSYQIVLRELQTLAGHMDRLHVWTRMAKEAAAKHA